MLTRMQGWRSAMTGETLRVGIAAALGIGYFLYSFGYRLLAPENVGWLLSREDPATYYLGWQFFRKEPWHFPLGHISSYMAPVGTSIGQTDSVPLMAFLLKPFSGVLPDTFQYFGIWIMISYLLMGVFSYLLLRRYCKNPWILWIGVLLLLTSPLQLRRQGGHIALASHWLILAGIWEYLRATGSDGFWRRVCRWGVLLVLCALIHPYLTVMVLGLAMAGLVRDGLGEKRGRWVARAAGAVILLAAIASTWILVGTITPGGPPVEPVPGFGKFSMNLNAPIDSAWSSRLVRPLAREHVGQYEGFAYFGVGILFAGAIALILLLRARPFHRSWQPHLPLILLLLAYFVFALSNKVTLGSHVLFEYPVPSFLDAAISTLRSSGRFFWPVYYSLVVGVVTVLATRTRARIGFAILALATMVQLYEFSGLAHDRRMLSERVYHTRLKSPLWAASSEYFDTITTFPPLLFTTQFKADFADLAWRADLNGQVVGTGYAGRFSSQLREQQTKRLEEIFTVGTPDPRTLYVFRGKEFAHFGPAMRDRFRCAELDGYPVCFAAEVPFPIESEFKIQEEDLTTFLSRLSGALVIVAVKDEATVALSDAQKQSLHELGLNVDALPYRGSYLGIAYQGQALWEQTSEDAPVDLELEAGETLGPVFLHRDLRLRSAGYLSGNVASIIIDGTEQSRNSRGLNICVLDDEQQVLWVGTFDTHVAGPGLVFPRAGRVAEGSP